MQFFDTENAGKVRNGTRTTKPKLRNEPFMLVNLVKDITGLDARTDFLQMSLMIRCGGESRIRLVFNVQSLALIDIITLANSNNKN